MGPDELLHQSTAEGFLQGDDEETDIQTVRRVELFENVHLFLNIPAEPVLPKDPLASDVPNKPGSGSKETLVEVKCRGRFRWDSEKLIASFEDQVDVTRHHPEALPDRLTCDNLAIHFERKCREE